MSRLGRLGRVVREPAPASTGQVPAPQGERPGKVCDMCTAPVAGSHQHVVNTDTRTLKCTCRPCWLLFTEEGAGGGRFRAVPERTVAVDLDLADGSWNRLDIPVGMVFVFHNSELDQPVAFYPSPAGATESELDLAAWDDIVAGNPTLDDAEPDTEAVLLRRLTNPDGPATFQGYIVGIDVCYELVGVVRMHWKGFDGGQQAHEAIDDFFRDLATSAAKPQPRMGTGFGALGPGLGMQGP